MNTPELSFTTPADLIAALPHLLGFVPLNDLVALLLGPAVSSTHVAMRAAIRCPITIDGERAQQFPELCQLRAEQFPGAILAAVCDPGHDEHAQGLLRTGRAALHCHGIIVHRVLATHSAHGRAVGRHQHR